jgi:hypothetical protein
MAVCAAARFIGRETDPCKGLDVVSLVNPFSAFRFSFKKISSLNRLPLKMGALCFFRNARNRLLNDAASYDVGILFSNTPL